MSVKLKNKSEEVFTMTRQEERQRKMVIRLEQYTTELKSLEVQKENYYKGHIKDMSRTTIVTLYQMQVYIDGVIKKICNLVDKLAREDVDHDNELAVEVYNYYAPQIRRGLSNLL